MEIRDLTITGGFDEFDGGGILNAADLTLTRVTLRGNESDGSGAAVSNLDTLTIVDSQISDNHAQCGNRLSGAVTNLGLQLDITGTTLSRNSKTCPTLPAIASGAGAALGNLGTSFVSSSTIAGNTMIGGLGGGGLANGGVATLNHVTFANNVSTGGPFGGDVVYSVRGGTTSLETSILAGACAVNPGFPGILISAGDNVESTGDTCGLIDASAQVNVSVANMALDTLAATTADRPRRRFSLEAWRPMPRCSQSAQRAISAAFRDQIPGETTATRGPSRFRSRSGSSRSRQEAWRCSGPIASEGRSGGASAPVPIRSEALRTDREIWGARLRR